MNCHNKKGQRSKAGELYVVTSEPIKKRFQQNGHEIMDTKSSFRFLIISIDCNIKQGSQLKIAYHIFFF